LIACGTAHTWNICIRRIRHATRQPIPSGALFVCAAALAAERAPPADLASAPPLSARADAGARGSMLSARTQPQPPLRVRREQRRRLAARAAAVAAAPPAPDRPPLRRAPRMAEPAQRPAEPAVLLLLTSPLRPEADAAPIRAAAAAAAAAGRRLLVHLPPAPGAPAAAAAAALLPDLELLYGAVASVAPTLDAVPLLPAAGWPADGAGLAAALGAPPAALFCRSGSEPRARSLAAALGAPPAALVPVPSGDGDGGGRHASPPPPAASTSEPAAAPLAPGGVEHVAVGGTFDRLHAGHRLLLAATAALAGRAAYLGVTDDALLAGKANRALLQPLAVRRDAAAAFLRSVRPGLAVTAGVLSDPAAPTAAETDPGVRGLVVSRETLAGARAINAGRARRGFAPLAVAVVGLVHGGGGGRGGGGGQRADDKLSSTQLREREAAAAAAAAAAQ